VQAGRRLEKIQALNQFLLTRLEEGGTAVLIIDEAHNLADDVWENLRLLSNFETASKKLLQIVLVGQPELAKKLGRPELRQLKQRIAIYCRLDRLKVQAVGPFIYHRLRVAGCTRQDVFTPEAIRRIAAYSGGIPRLINMICENALLIAYGTAQQTVGETIIEKAANGLLLKREYPLVAYEKTSEEEALWNAQMAYREQGLTDRTDAVGTADRGVTTTPQNGLEETPQAPAAEISRSWARRFTWVGIAISIVLLLRVGSVLIFPQQTRARIADLSSIESRAPIEQEKDKPGAQESRPITPDPSSLPTRDEYPESPKAETLEPLSPTQSTDFSEEKWQGQSVTITRGDTITAIVFKVYGNYNVLAFDLIKEFNPHIADLNRIAVGKQVWLPFLMRETLLRKQADGSYHLIIGSFHRKGNAERVARTARRQGYAVTITQRRMSGTHLLHRVEIERLQDLAAVDRAWSRVVQGKT
jgi:AAA domain/SPOR domain